MTPEIPPGWQSYTGPSNWKLIKGALFLNGVGQWCRVAGGAHAIPGAKIVVPAPGFVAWLRRVTGRQSTLRQGVWLRLLP